MESLNHPLSCGPVLCSFLTWEPKVWRGCPRSHTASGEAEIQSQAFQLQNPGALVPLGCSTHSTTICPSSSSGVLPVCSIPSRSCCLFTLPLAEAKKARQGGNCRTRQLDPPPETEGVWEVCSENRWSMNWARVGLNLEMEAELCQAG